MLEGDARCRHQAQVGLEGFAQCFASLHAGHAALRIGDLARGQ